MTNRVPDFSVSQQGNNQSTFLFPELLPPTRFTDNLRFLQAAIRRQWNQGQWFEYGGGDLAATFSFVSSTEFSVIGALEAVEYHIGRRVRAIGSIVGTITGSIAAVSQSGGNTNVTVNWDSGGLSNESFIIELGLVGVVGGALPRGSSLGQAFLGDNDFQNDVSVGGDLDVSGAISAPSASFNRFSSGAGPFSLISQVARVSGGTSIIVPDDTKRAIIEVYGAGGGGTHIEETRFLGIDRVRVRSGGDGRTAVVSSSPSGRSITVPGASSGGTGGNGRIGQDQESGASVSTAGVFRFVASIPGLGSPGGAAAFGESDFKLPEGGVSNDNLTEISGIVGNAGSYVRAIVDAPQSEVRSWRMAGGNGGSGATAGDGFLDSGDGGRASMVISFYG